MRFDVIDFKLITCNIPNTFEDADIDRAAKAIDKLGCLSFPLVLVQTGAETFELIDGAFYYYAVERAIGLNIRNSMVNSMIGEKSDADILRRQAVE